MRVILLIAFVAALSGCAAQVMSATDRSVVVKARIQDVADAQQLAEAECAKSGRKARLSGKLTQNQYVFDCVF
jgi:hypothetical protein